MSVQKAAEESTCLKRVTVCAIYDRAGVLLSCESNRCEPPGGVCQRTGVLVDFKDQAEYPKASQCGWTHAERMALASLPEGAKPYHVDLYGHFWPCPDCEAALKAAGVEQINAVGDVWGTGLRS